MNKILLYCLNFEKTYLSFVLPLGNSLIRGTNKMKQSGILEIWTKSGRLFQNPREGAVKIWEILNPAFFKKNLRKENYFSWKNLFL